MKSIKSNLGLILIFLFSVSCVTQSMKIAAERDNPTWKYEIEAVGVGVTGTYQIKVWVNCKYPENVVDLGKKYAVHGIIFKGFPKKDRVEGKAALAPNASLEQEKAEYFKTFFATGGKYLNYITLTNNGAIAAGDRIKMGKEYKIGLIVSVNVADLRKELEKDGIIKALGDGF